MAAHAPIQPGVSRLDRRIRHEWLCLAAALLLLTGLLGYFQQTPVIAQLDHLAYDMTMRATARTPADSNIVIVAINDDSITALGYWPWRRATHANLIDRLNEARAIGLDIILQDYNPAYPNDDRRLAEAISKHGRVVLPEIFDARRNALIAPLPILAKAAHSLGRIDAAVDDDSAIRSIIMQRRMSSGERLPHFVAALADAGRDMAAVDNARAVPDGGSRLIDYAGPTGSYTVYPYVQVLNGIIPASTFRDKYVLVGAWASGLGDRLPTPTARGTPMPGVEILANGLQNLRDDLWIHIPRPWLAALLSILPVLLVCLWQRRLSPRHCIMLSFGALIGIIALDGLLMQYARIWVPPAASLLGVLLAYPLWSWRSQEATLQHIDRELERLHSDHKLSQPNLGPGAHATLPARAVRLHHSVEALRLAVHQREKTLRFISHDMRSPQNSILALIELRRLESATLSDQELLERIGHHAHDTLNLVDGFVQLARAESMQIKLREEDLVELVSGVCDERWPQAAHRSIDIEFESRYSHAPARIDAGLIARAIGNLLDNAIQYSPEGSTIRCTIERTQDAWEINVHDQGSGIPPDKIEIMFAPFTRLNEGSHGAPTGSGLGLAFVRTAMQRHGGSIECHGTPDAGNTFVATLPAGH